MPSAAEIAKLARAQEAERGCNCEPEIETGIKEHKAFAIVHHKAACPAIKDRKGRRILLRWERHQL